MDTVFTPWQSLAGGALIGLASTLLMLMLGRIMGATGILAGLLSTSSFQDSGWRLALLLGMISGPLAVLAISGQMPLIQVPVSTPMLVVGGFIVGIGVTYASGCTSGHGVCGIARLSRRSIVATAVFMIATGLTVYAVRHLWGA
jgi:hypothetical protein